MTVWIKAEVRAGMFSSERIATFPVADGEASFFVQDHTADEKGQRIRVRVIDRNETRSMIALHDAGNPVSAVISNEIILGEAGPE